jgi:hypothetical protein
MGIEKIVKIEEFKPKRDSVTVWNIQVSGGDTFIYNGIVIHNSIVERGWNGGIVWIDSYTRKDGVFVRGHNSNQPRREGKHYIENPLRTYFGKNSGGIFTFREAVLKYLRNHYKNVVVV